MATEVVHEHDHTAGGDGSGAVVGVILFVILLLFLLYFFGSGMFRGFIGGTGGTNIQVPDKVNVNLNQGGGGKSY